MSENVSLSLKIAGTDIKGDSTHKNLGRENSIECVFFEHSVNVARDVASGMATGRRQYAPILIRKRIDKSTPLLFKALTTNQAVEGIFRFFRPSPTGDGTTEQFYTITIKKAKISSLKNYVPDTLLPATANLPALEEVSFVFEEITWLYTNGNIIHQDSLGGVR